MKKHTKRPDEVLPWYKPTEYQRRRYGLFALWRHRCDADYLGGCWGIIREVHRESSDDCDVGMYCEAHYEFGLDL